MAYVYEKRKHRPEKERKSLAVKVHFVITTNRTLVAFRVV